MAARLGIGKFFRGVAQGCLPLLGSLALFAAPCAAAGGSKGTPGRFDYYLLTLSWSPNWCADHGRERGSRLQCDRQPPLGLVLHGLWPQYRDGSWPEFCRTSDPVPQFLVDRMKADIPSEPLIRHEWARHGTCSGLAVDAYFGAMDRLFHAIHAPDALQKPEQPATLDGNALKAQLVAANPGLAAADIVLVCGADRHRLDEIEICLSHDLGFRACGPSADPPCAGEIQPKAAS